MSAVEHKIPANPLEFIQACVRLGKVKWTYHVNMRLKERFIPRTHILESTNHYEIIEAYPKDKFHILFAVDVDGDHVRIVTAYCPAPQVWDRKLKKRR